MMTDKSFNCCGWAEMFYTANWDGTVADFNRYLLLNTNRAGNGLCGAVFFSSNSITKAGHNKSSRLADLITKLNIGEVTKLPTFTNPNTGNTIHSYAWIINKRRLASYVTSIKQPRTKAKGGFELY
jgi:hypothetical protein